MTASVVTKDAEFFREFRELRIPHGESGAERIGEEKDGSGFGAGERVI